MEESSIAYIDRLAPEVLNIIFSYTKIKGNMSCPHAVGFPPSLPMSTRRSRIVTTDLPIWRTDEFDLTQHFQLSNNDIKSTVNYIEILLVDENLVCAITPKRTSKRM